MEQITLTEHARIRMCSRRIPIAAVEMVFMYGREKHVKGATFYVLGRREVEKFRETGVDLRDYEGIQVVCANGDLVVTTYRNKDFSGLRPRRPKWRTRKRIGRQTNPWPRGAAA